MEIKTVGVVGAGVFWWMRNKDALMARAKEVVTEAKDFGRNSDNQGCVDESISRYKKEPGFSSAISNSICPRKSSASSAVNDPDNTRANRRSQSVSSRSAVRAVGWP